MNAFEFASATRVLFGFGRASAVPEWLRERGLRRVLLVTGRDGERARGMRSALEALAIHVEGFSVAGEPRVEDARAGAEHCRACSIDAVLAFGGGGAIDAGKAIAALAANPGDVLDYLEVVGRGQPLERDPLPFVAVPTTAGTGAEVTRNAVLGSKKHGVKASLRSPALLPRLAVVDPELLRTAPRPVLRASGLDALSQLIEPFVSVRANPLSDALAREGIARSTVSLKRAVLDTASDDDLENLALASLFGGLCLTNSGLGAVHGFAAPIGGMFDAPHGAVCAALLPHVMRQNLRSLRARNPRGPGLARYTELARLLTQRPDACAEDGAEWVAALTHDLEVPSLSSYGVAAAHIDELVKKASRASSMKGNPLVLGADELETILSSAL